MSSGGDKEILKKYIFAKIRNQAKGKEEVYDPDQITEK
jgi:hypothetical protein